MVKYKEVFISLLVKLAYYKLIKIIRLFRVEWWLPGLGASRIGEMMVKGTKLQLEDESQHWVIVNDAVLHASKLPRD